MNHRKQSFSGDDALSIQHWQALLDAEHEQSDRMRGLPPPADFWPLHAQAFRADPRRAEDLSVPKTRSC